MSFVKRLQCRECDQDYPQEPLHVCETCFGPLEIVYDYDAIERDQPRKDRVTRQKSLALPQAAAERRTTSGSDVLGYNGTDLINPVKPNTIASSIAIGNPADSFYVVHAIKESGGWGESVTDKEVMKGSSFSQVLKEFLPSRREEPKFR